MIVPFSSDWPVGAPRGEQPSSVSKRALAMRSMRSLSYLFRRHETCRSMRNHAIRHRRSRRRTRPPCATARGRRRHGGTHLDGVPRWTCDRARRKRVRELQSGRAGGAYVPTPFSALVLAIVGCTGAPARHFANMTSSYQSTSTSLPRSGSSSIFRMPTTMIRAIASISMCRSARPSPASGDRVLSQRERARKQG